MDGGRQYSMIETSEYVVVALCELSIIFCSETTPYPRLWMLIMVLRQWGRRPSRSLDSRMNIGVRNGLFVVLLLVAVRVKFHVLLLRRRPPWRTPCSESMKSYAALHQRTEQSPLSVRRLGPRAASAEITLAIEGR